MPLVLSTKKQFVRKLVQSNEIKGALLLLVILKKHSTHPDSDEISSGANGDLEEKPRIRSSDTVTGIVQQVE